MNVNSVNNASFKGMYKIKGSTDTIDEICWYMQRQRKNTAMPFDFLDLRLQNETKSFSDSLTDHLLKDVTKEDILNKDSINKLLEHLDNLKNSKNDKPFYIGGSRPKPNIDLFLTQNDKEFAEPKLRNMVEDTVGNRFYNVSIVDKVKYLLKDLSQMREALSKGKPITNIQPFVVEDHLKNVKKMAKPLDADEVLANIKSNKFDIANGIIA